MLQDKTRVFPMQFTNPKVLNPPYPTSLSRVYDINEAEGPPRGGRIVGMGCMDCLGSGCTACRSGMYGGYSKSGTAGNLYAATTTNLWQKHLREYSAANGISYAIAISDPGARASYYAKKGLPVPATTKKRKLKNPNYGLLDRYASDKAKKEAKKAVRSVYRVSRETKLPVIHVPGPVEVTETKRGTVVSIPEVEPVELKSIAAAASRGKRPRGVELESTARSKFRQTTKKRLTAGEKAALASQGLLQYD